MAGRRHGENAYRRSARQMAEAGKAAAQAKLLDGSRANSIEAPLPCMCASGVAQTKARHSDPNYDGRHWHERQWESWVREVRKTDAKGW